MLKSAISCSGEKTVSSTLGYTRWSDWGGMAASIGCAIHCAAMPLVIAFLPALGLGFLADESFHQVMVGVCSALAIAAFVPGWRRHGRLAPIGIAGIGLSLIAVAAFALEGSCCQACAGATANTHTTSGEAEKEACCQFCVESKNTADSEATSLSPAHATNATSTDLAKPSLAGFIPWVTPLGGMFLLAAHLSNRRCASQCCSGATQEVDS